MREAPRARWSVLIHEATVFQERNEHNLMTDFAQEADGHDALHSLPLAAGLKNIPDAMRKCYRCLVDNSWIAPAELDLLEAWLKDHDQALNSRSSADCNVE